MGSRSGGRYRRSRVDRVVEASVRAAEPRPGRGPRASQVRRVHRQVVADARNAYSGPCRGLPGPREEPESGKNCWRRGDRPVGEQSASTRHCPARLELADRRGAGPGAGRVSMGFDHAGIVAEQRFAGTFRGTCRRCSEPYRGRSGGYRCCRRRRLPCPRVLPDAVGGIGLDLRTIRDRRGATGRLAVPTPRVLPSPMVSVQWYRRSWLSPYRGRWRLNCSGPHCLLTGLASRM